VILSLTEDAARRVQTWCVAKPVEAGSVARKAQDGRVVLQVDFDHDREARFIVLGLGSAVQVVEPESLRQWVEDEARAVADATSVD